MERITLRGAKSADQPWMAALYADVRRDEVRQFGWNVSMTEAFLSQQFELQQRGYLVQHPAAICQVIERASAGRDGNDEPVGRLWVDRDDDELNLLDISLWSAWRGRGIGSQCLQSLIDEATRCERPIRLHVAHGNPAQRLYERLGFVIVDHCPPYVAMRWQPARVGSSLLAEVCHEQA